MCAIAVGAQRTIRRKPSSLTHIDNTILTLELPKEHLYHTLHLRLVGELNVTVAATLAENGILNLIKNANVKIDGSITPKSANGVLLYYGATYENQQAPRLSQPAVGVAVNAFSCDIPIRFILPRKTIQPYSTLLNSDPFKTFQLHLTTGAVGDVISAGTATLQNFTYEIWSEEIKPRQASRLDLNQESQIDIAFTAANANLQQEYPRGNLYKRWLIRALSNSLQSDTVINKVKLLLNGTEVVQELDWDELLDQNQSYYHIAPQTGIAILEVDERGAFEELIPSANLSTIKLVFDVDAPTASIGLIETLPLEIILNVLAAA